jgi:glycine/D-amino acid oxidase-like deaminating enzyme
MPDLADVVIVGGGILGAALACELSRRYTVALLEARQLAGGASGNGFAWINATTKDEDETYHRLNAQAMAHYNALAAQFGPNRIGIAGGGALFWVTTENAAERDALRQRAARLQSWDYPVALLDRAELQALEPEVRFPETTMEGLFAPADRWVEPQRLIRFLIEQARQRNADIREFCPVTGFTQSVTGGISTVETAQGRIATRQVVLAAGLQTPALVAKIGEDSRLVPVEPLPGLLVETPPDTAVGQIHRILHPPDSQRLRLRPTPAGGLLIGADDTDALVQAQPEMSLPAAAPRSLYARARQILPGLPDLEVRAMGRVCVRPMPADGYPIIGALPSVKGVYVAVTHSGITLGPYLARLLAEEILTGQPPAPLRPYRPTRFSGS